MTTNKPREVVSTRILEKISGEFGDEKNKVNILEEVIRSSELNCPTCHKHWPKKESGAKPHISIRIKPEYKNKIKSLANTSRFLSAVLCSSYGFCPVCEQKI